LEKEKLMDDLDKLIVEELRKNGRESYKKIAKKLNVSDGTIRFRVNRMIKANIIKISALVNPFIFKHSIAALIRMQLEKRNHIEAMEKISRLKGVVSVCNATGSYDLFVEVLLQSRDELNKFLVEDLSKIEGIKSTETSVYLDAINKWLEYPELKSSEHGVSSNHDT